MVWLHLATIIYSFDTLKAFFWAFNDMISQSKSWIANADIYSYTVATL